MAVSSDSDLDDTAEWTNPEKNVSLEALLEEHRLLENRCEPEMIVSSDSDLEDTAERTNPEYNASLDFVPVEAAVPANDCFPGIFRPWESPESRVPVERPSPSAYAEFRSGVSVLRSSTPVALRVEDVFTTDD